MNRAIAASTISGCSACGAWPQPDSIIDIFPAPTGGIDSQHCHVAARTCPGDTGGMTLAASTVVRSFILELYIRVVLPRATQVLIPSIVGSAALPWPRRRFGTVGGARGSGEDNCRCGLRTHHV